MEDTGHEEAQAAAVELENELNSDCESLPKKQKIFATRKFQGASIYKSKFQRHWQEKWPCVTPSKINPYSFYCTVCSKPVSCGHQGERDVTRHIASSQHQKLSKALEKTPTLETFSPLAKRKKNKVKKFIIDPV